ncbi:MAG: type II secretion system F family protein [Elusimicrobiota bacterium]
MDSTGLWLVKAAGLGLFLFSVTHLSSLLLLINKFKFSKHTKNSSVITKLIEWYRRTKKVELFNRQLVDALGMISTALKAGVGIQQAFEQVAQEMAWPISVEFKTVVDDVKLGVPFIRAIEAMAQRGGSKELSITVAAISIAQEAGGNLSDVLARLAVTMRERYKLQSKIAALTAQGRLSGYVISALPILILSGMWVLDPVLMRPMYTTVYGILVLILILLMTGLGLFLIQKVVEIDI